MTFFSHLTSEFPSFLFPGKFSDIAALSLGNKNLLRPELHSNSRPQKHRAISDRQTALVIGGNGFVGAHLTGRLSLEKQIKKVLITVRSHADKTPLERFQEVIDFYRIPICMDKITILHASPLEKNWGINQEQYLELTNDIHMLFSCASSTDYSKSYLEYRHDWFFSFLRALQFCIDGTNKHFTYLGSMGSHLYQNPDDFIRPDSWWYSGYAQMKWVTGGIMRWLAHDQLLPVTLCEASYVLGSTSLGLDPGLHYSWWRLIEIAKSIQTIWSGDGLNYCPVDILVDVLVRNALAEKPMDYLQPCNPISYDTILWAELLNCNVVSWDCFKERAERRIPIKRLSQLLMDDFSLATHIVNSPAIFTPDYPFDWCNNRDLFRFYLEKIPFRDVRKKTEKEKVGSVENSAVLAINP